MSSKLTGSKSLQGLISNLAAVSEKRKEIDQASASLKKIEDDLVKKVTESLNEAGLTSASNGKNSVELVPNEAAKVEDWDTLYAYVKQEDAFELLHKRINLTSCKDRWNNGGTVPGVVKTTYTKLKY